MAETTTIAINLKDRKRLNDFLHFSRSRSHREAFGKLLDVAEEQQAEAST